MSEAKVVEQAERYYDSGDADEFYFRVWGGEDIHVGCYESADEPIATASRRTVTRMSKLVELDPSKHVVDFGAGYGGAARQLSTRFGCKVSCLNLSETQNARNREQTRAAGLQDKVEVFHGAFEEAPFDDACCDVVWSQDAFLHSPDRARVLKEARRILRPGGTLVFTDPMQAEKVPDGVLEPVLARIHLASLGSISEYRRWAEEAGFGPAEVIELTDQLSAHYTRVRAELTARHDELVQFISPDYLERMLAGLGHWIEAGQKGYLAWGILRFQAN
jgi:sarcosine/dimethylglycine N-methyltransferase